MKSKRTKKVLDLDTELQKLGSRLKQLRMEKGYTNKDFFAYDHRIHPAQYSRYERGHDLQYSTLIKLLNAFEISVAQFFSEGFD
jgi:transcriptional regulator with XRE-family HTH domain